MDKATKTGLYSLKSASKKVIYEVTEAKSESLGNKSAYKIVKPDENLRNVEEIIIPPEKIDEILNELRQVL